MRANLRGYLEGLLRGYHHFLCPGLRIIDRPLIRAFFILIAWFKTFVLRKFVARFHYSGLVGCIRVGLDWRSMLNLDNS
jgi:hypothetical protein